ncbi:MULTISPECIES: DUF3742 family protein [Pseudomonas syringae group]|uniref:DUF3742 family protein n=3 Tax=Pseudomonas syringae group TaxID=136849 RepID=A0AAW4E621_PSESX|nr:MULTISPECIES: DUF3742 family protein [Pseudomonas syringae group]KPZ14599.1 Uncharacterized protein ALO94_02159 [Pseudomonas syringae pv. spinaceae]KUR42085.1 hypothetical protein PSTA9_03549 [Pseudomonas syringae pv. tomato]KUR51913.1 hypothetical protein PST407_00005 [Pseudomonas syringae pv. tomato]MBF9246693.1 DUF3742 family protein [Pseudomonas syringae pv. tomato]MBI6698263.1 DUF3742 family protein [Pseudomonas syringae]
MTPDANTDLSGAARFGHVLGRGLRRILNVERAFWSLFDRTGVPRVIVTPVKWGARAAVIGTGAFFVAWGLLYVLGVVAMAMVVVGLINSESSSAVSSLSDFEYEDDEHAARLQASVFEENDDHNWDFVLGRGVYPSQNE